MMVHDVELENTFIKFFPDRTEVWMTECPIRKRPVLIAVADYGMTQEQIAEMAERLGETVEVKGAMPVGSDARRKAAQRKTDRSRRVSRAIGKRVGGMKQRRHKRIEW